MRFNLIPTLAVVCAAIAVQPAAAASTSITLQAPTARVADVAIRGGTYASTNFEGGLLVTRASSDATYVRRTLLDFDTQSAIPAGSTIVSATLTLTVHWGGSAASRLVAVYNVTTPFVTSQATWDMATSTTPWHTPGGDLGREYTTSSVSNVAGAQAHFNVTALVQAAVSSSGSRHSLMALVDVDSLTNGREGYRDYYPSEASTASNRPTLVVTYTAPTLTSGVPDFAHVFVVVMENHEYSQIIGNSAAPFINSLAKQYGLATNYTAITHPSLPNYMALTGGHTVFTTDCSGCTTAAKDISDEVYDSGRSWKAYMESMPAPCTTVDSGLYAQKHNPFVHYADIVTNTTRCDNHVVPLSSFSTDLSAGHVASYVWITPNLCDDMHDCSIATGDTWLSKFVPQIMNAPSFAKSVLFIVWDEGTTDVGGGGQVAAIVVSPWTPAGLRYAGQANHYSLLRTIEDGWKLAPLGDSQYATAMSAFFTGR